MIIFIEHQGFVVRRLFIAWKCPNSLNCAWQHIWQQFQQKNASTEGFLLSGTHFEPWTSRFSVGVRTSFVKFGHLLAPFHGPMYKRYNFRVSRCHILAKKLDLTTFFQKILRYFASRYLVILKLYKQKRYLHSPLNNLDFHSFRGRPLLGRRLKTHLGVQNSLLCMNKNMV